MSSQAQKRYFVAVTRPVIQSIIIEVDAANEEEAVEKAFQEAFERHDDDWSGKFEPDNYGHDVVSVMEQAEPSLRVEEDFVLQDRIRDVKYMLLRGDAESTHGAMLFQPWLYGRSSLYIAEVCRDWMDDIRLLSTEGVEGLAEWVEDPLLDATPLPPEVTARLPWLCPKGSKDMGGS